MNPLIDFDFILLQEWQKMQNRAIFNRQQYFPVRIFGSFLNPDSWEFTRKCIRFFMHAQDGDEKTLNMCSRAPSPLTILFIFFPVSLDFQVNARFLNYLQKYIMEPDDNSANQQFLKYQQEAINFVQRKSFYLRYQLNPQTSLPSSEKSNTTNKNQNQLSRREIARKRQTRVYQENKLLYGSIAAHYLQSITKFPQIWVEDQYFDGIPLHESLEHFSQHILFPAIQSIMMVS